MRSLAVRIRLSLALLGAIFLFSVFGCARDRSGGGPGPGRQSRPVWVDSPASADTPYRLTAVGAGENRDQAESNALARLAQRLSARVESQEVMTRFDEQVSGDGEMAVRTRILLERLNRVSTDLPMIGARVEAVYADAAGHQFALVSVEIDATFASHMATGRTALRSAQEQWSLRDAVDDPAERVRVLAAAQRDALDAADAFAIALGLRPESDAARDGRLEAASLALDSSVLLDAALRAVTVSVITLDTTSQRVASTVEQAVTDFGVAIGAPSNRRVRLHLRATLVLAPAESFDARYTIRRWRLTLDLGDGDGRRLASVTRSGVVSETSVDRAESVAMDNALDATPVAVDELLHAALLDAH